MTMKLKKPSPAQVLAEKTAQLAQIKQSVDSTVVMLAANCNETIETLQAKATQSLTELSNEIKNDLSSSKSVVDEKKLAADKALEAYIQASKELTTATETHKKNEVTLKEKFNNVSKAITEAIAEEAISAKKALKTAQKAEKQRISAARKERISAVIGEVVALVAYDANVVKDTTVMAATAVKNVTVGTAYGVANVVTSVPANFKEGFNGYTAEKTEAAPQEKPKAKTQAKKNSR